MGAVELVKLQIFLSVLLSTCEAISKDPKTWDIYVKCISARIDCTDIATKQPITYILEKLDEVGPILGIFTTKHNGLDVTIKVLLKIDDWDQRLFYITEKRLRNENYILTKLNGNKEFHVTNGYVKNYNYIEDAVLMKKEKSLTKLFNSDQKGPPHCSALVVTKVEWNLYNFVRRERYALKCDQRRVRQYILGMVEGLQKIHSKGFLHNNVHLGAMGLIGDYVLYKDFDRSCELNAKTKIYQKKKVHSRTKKTDVLGDGYTPVMTPNSLRGGSRSYSDDLQSMEWSAWEIMGPHPWQCDAEIKNDWTENRYFDAINKTERMQAQTNLTQYYQQNHPDSWMPKVAESLESMHPYIQNMFYPELIKIAAKNLR